jgi:hypothetical protein
MKNLLRALLLLGILDCALAGKKRTKGPLPSMNQVLQVTLDGLKSSLAQDKVSSSK